MGLKYNLWYSEQLLSFVFIVSGFLLDVSFASFVYQNQIASLTALKAKLMRL
ncbi:hypothetical protein RCH20_000957 [Psychrobacter sp. PL15]|jgi:hypothetical protein|nr:hypothetical protein [Psychrobacter sp. PL15]